MSIYFSLPISGDLLQYLPISGYLLVADLYFSPLCQSLGPSQSLVFSSLPISEFLLIANLWLYYLCQSLYLFSLPSLPIYESLLIATLHSFPCPYLLFQASLAISAPLSLSPPPPLYPIILLVPPWPIPSLGFFPRGLFDMQLLFKFARANFLFPQFCEWGRNGWGGGGGHKRQTIGKSDVNCRVRTFPHTCNICMFVYTCVL